MNRSGAVAANEHSPNDPGGDDPIGYISLSARVTYHPDNPSSASAQPGIYSLDLGAGTHEGAVPYEFMFFTLPSQLTALGEDIAVTFQVTYPDGTTLNDTQVRSVSGSSFDDTLESDPFVVYEAGNYGITAYLFVDGVQIGGAYVDSVSVDGVIWDY